jgi:DNA-binding SARP family transcriptional activator
MTEPQRLGSSARPRLTLITLGSWALASADAAGAPTPVFGPSKPLALLAYLACAPGRTARREHLADLLWADLEQDGAHHAFRQTLWYVRQRIGTDGLASDAVQVSLTADVEIDRDRFDAAVARQDHEQAVTLYTGDFLPGFAAPGGAEFEQWADLERGRLRRAFLRAAGSLVQLRLDASRFREAVTLARRVHDTDPHAEPGWRVLIEALLSSGDRLGAALEADRLRQWLAAEGREPEPATRGLLRQASEGAADEAADAPISTGAPAIVAELVGREREFAAILDAWSAARSGPARFVHVLGAAGLGKTRLLGDIRARLRATGARCVLVRANPGERGVAFACAADLAAALAGLTGAMGISSGAAATLVGLCPALSARYPAARHDHGAAEELVRHRILAIAELVAAVSEEGPLAILLDDTHWMDGASRQALMGVATRLGAERVLVVSASRPTPATDLSRPDAVPLALEPLTPAQVGALVSSLGELPDEPWAGDFAARLHAASSGSPLLALETLQLVVERGVLSITDDRWRCGDPSALASALSEGSAVERRVAALGRDQQWLLLLLAVAGAPFRRVDMDPLAAKPAEAVDRDLVALEQRGFLTRYGEHVAPAHDSIAEAALTGALPEARRAANLAMGRALAQGAASDPDLATRAARHLAAAGDTADLGRVLALTVRQARRRGDRRPLRLVVTEALGRANAGAIAGAMRLLPLSVRVGLTTPARVAAAVAVPIAAAGIALSILLRATATPEVALVVRTRIDATHETLVAVALTDALFETSGPLDLRTLRTVRSITPRIASLAEVVGRVVPQPGGRWWAYWRVSPDTGGEDLYAATPDGMTRRLTATRGDDVSPAWSPDGRWLVFPTDRWNARSASDLAVMDFDAGTVRQLTSGNDRDHGPAWSPDGSRIAFTRYSYGRGGQSLKLCWIAFDGRKTECVEIPGREWYAVVGWLDPNRLLLQNHENALTLEAFDLRTRRLTPLTSGGTTWIGADRRFVSCLCSETPGGPLRPYVFPVEHPDRARRIVAAGEVPLVPVTWTRPDALRPWIERLAIDLPADSAIPVDEPFHLSLHGWDQRGEAVAVPAGVVEWAASDTTVATVDQDGTMRPRREGNLTVTVSAGGWRTTSARLRVGPARLRSIVTENWRRGIGPTWRAFGGPRPFTTTGPAGIPALAQNGDSSWVSGVYSTAELSLADGLGVEVLVSSPIAEDRWQTVQVNLYGGIDSAALSSWDHTLGFGPLGRARIQCGAALPGGESVGLLDQLYLAAGGENRLLPRGTASRSGRWWRLRVQVLPDGRCGVAVNGKPVWLSEQPLRADLRYRLVLLGMSFHTRILFGPVEVWQGVRRDVDWEAAARRPPQ